MAQRYTIQDMNQARRYLADPILGDRLRHDVRLIVNHKGKSALEIFGSPDDLKFRSCITLFFEAASNQSDRSLFAQALQQFYNGEAHPPPGPQNYSATNNFLVGLFRPRPSRD